MALIFVICALHCCTQVLSPTKDFDKQDWNALERAQLHCQNEHKCLIKFRKVESGIYTAICGKENN